MKALKIKTTVSLNTGLSVASGSVLIVDEGYVNIKGIRTIPAIELEAEKQVIPCYITCRLFKSLTSYQEGKVHIDGILDFNPTFSGLLMSVEAYTMLPTQDLIIGVLQENLEAIYPGKIEVIEI